MSGQISSQPARRGRNKLSGRSLGGAQRETCLHPYSLLKVPLESARIACAPEARQSQQLPHQLITLTPLALLHRPRSSISRSLCEAEATVWLLTCACVSFQRLDDLDAECVSRSHDMAGILVAASRPTGRQGPRARRAGLSALPRAAADEADFCAKGPVEAMRMATTAAAWWPIALGPWHDAATAAITAATRRPRRGRKRRSRRRRRRRSAARRPPGGRGHCSEGTVRHDGESAPE